MKYILSILIVLAVTGGAFLIFQSQTGNTTIENPATPEPVPEPDTPQPDTSTPTTSTDGTEQSTSTATEATGEFVLGQSVAGRPISGHRFGTGDQEVLFVGGIHGGYSWNTPLVAFELISYLNNNPDVIPDNLTVTVIPVLNPDGLYETVGTTGRFNAADVPNSEAKQIAGRFNANNVDLNRNFSCEWAPESMWQERTVSGGSEPFSEPESQAVREYVTNSNLVGAVIWYSAAGGVYASNCGGDVAPETSTLTELYANASGYDAFASYDYYEINGDMANWLAQENVPAISVLLSNHQQTEWEKNRAGIEAVLNRYATQ